MLQLKELRINNFNSIEYAKIKFWKNKTVFVWKNNAWKSNILKCIALFFSWNHKSILSKHFSDQSKEMYIEADIIISKNEIITLIIKSTIVDWKVITLYEENYNENEKIKINEFLKKVDFIYIPSDRTNLNTDSSWYTKIVDLILENKIESMTKNTLDDLKSIVSDVNHIVPENIKTNFSSSLSHLDKVNFNVKNENDNEIMQNLSDLVKEEEWKKWIEDFDDLTIWTRNSILIALFDLFLKSSKNIKNTKYRLFIIDQPENFLHPHSIRLIDRLLQDIWEIENTQIIYSTHANELVSNFKKDKFEIDDLRFVYKKNWVTKVKQIENKWWRYDKIMINLLFKNTDIFFSDAIILVEWETEKISIPNIYEYYPWNMEDLNDCKLGSCKIHLAENKIWDFFNLSLKNIAVLDVGGKWALAERYEFCSEVLWKRNVFAIMDRDPNFEDDKKNIFYAIKNVWWEYIRDEKKYIDYNWVILDWEFENYYKPEKMKEFLSTVLREKYRDDYLTKKEINNLIYKLDNIRLNWKISVSYEKIFKTYLRWFWKPTIAFNLCIWLCQNNWYKYWLMRILKNILYKIEKERLN